jgi:hypothetical protein
VAAVFDGDGDGMPFFTPDRRRIVDAGQRQRINGYLMGAPLVIRADGLETDPLDPSRGAVVPVGYRSDGVWVWQEASAYYLTAYGVAVEQEFLEHIQRAGYVAPVDLSDEVADEAALAALDPTSAPAIDTRRNLTYVIDVDGGRTVETAGGLFRQWTDEQGNEHDQAIDRGLNWRRTSVFVTNSYSGERDLETVSVRDAARIVDRFWRRFQ